MSEADRARLRRREVGVVFQAFNLLPALTVAENVALPLLLDGRSDADTDARVDETLRAVGLEGRRHHLADQLSGGEGQRVAIARALAVRPSLILADEPTGNLDRATGATILSLLEHAQRSFGSTIVLVTHDERGATYGSRILHLADGRVTADRSEAA
jgi:predicted ABC-type transport system involved in lysophospholipase L1 biosynthesis ATPase subunit